MSAIIVYGRIATSLLDFEMSTKKFQYFVNLKAGTAMLRPPVLISICGHRSSYKLKLPFVQHLYHFRLKVRTKAPHQIRTLPGPKTSQYWKNSPINVTTSTPAWSMCVRSDIILSELKTLSGPIRGIQLSDKAI